jgi:hypothetical protein
VVAHECAQAARLLCAALDGITLLRRGFVETL